MNFLVFILLFYSLVNKVTKDRTTAILFTFLLASVRQFNNYAFTGYADMELALFSFVTFASFYLWREKDDIAYYVIAVFCALFSFWTKNEGSVVLAITVFLSVSSALAARRAKVFKAAAVSALVLSAVFMLWTWYKAHVNITNDIMNASSLKRLDLAKDLVRRSSLILYEYQKHVFGFKYWNMAWIIFLISLVAGGIKNLRRYA